MEPGPTKKFGRGNVHETLLIVDISGFGVISALADSASITQITLRF